MALKNLNKAVFFDKDGTIIKNVPYNVDINKIELLPSVAYYMKLLKKNGYMILIITNQSGIAKGDFTEEEFKESEKYLRSLFIDQGLYIDGFYYCPHHPEGRVAKYNYNCECRKPKAGMILQAAKDLKIDLSESWMIGDILDDIEAGNRAGCKTILLDYGNETEWKSGRFRSPDFISNDIGHVVTQILESEFNFSYVRNEKVSESY